MRQDRAPRWIVAWDFDSTLWPEETLDAIMKRGLQKGSDREERVKAIGRITDLGMGGEICMRESYEQRLKLANIGKGTIQQYLEDGPDYDPALVGIVQDLRASGQKVVVVSGGMREWIVPLTSRIGISPEEVWANELIWEEDEAQGLHPESLMRESDGKRAVLTSLREQYPHAQIMMIGDGSTDAICAQAPRTCDLMIGYQAVIKREGIAEKADVCVGSPEALRSVMEDQGILPLRA